MQWRAFGLLACLGGACQRAPTPETRPTPSAPAPAAPAASAAAAIGSVLTGVRARISLATPDWQLQPIAFGAHLLAILGREQVRAFSLPEGTLLLEEPLAAPRGVVGIAGGSLLVAGGDRALRLDPGAKKAVVLPPLPWLPGTLLLPERRDSGFVWAVQTGGRLFVRQRLDLDPARSFDASITLEDYAGGPVTVLRDGAFLYAAAGGVRRALPSGRPHPFPTSFPIFRLLPGRRVDQAWAVGSDGSVELWVLGDRLRVEHRFAVGAAPFDAAANERFLAVVVVDEPGNAPRAFRLLVFDNEGKRVLEHQLPPGPPETGEDWTVRAVENRHVALGEGEPFVAVGGPGNVEVLVLPAGTPVLTR
jgi:hypothetical protein